MPPEIDQVRVDDAAWLRQYLADRDAACPSCSYNLRGLPTDRCPECNQHLTLRVGLTEPRLGWWLIAVIADCMGFGFNALLLLYALIQMAMRPSFRLLPIYFIAHQIVGALVHGLILLHLIRNSGRIRRAAAGARIGLALSLAALSLLNILLFSLLIR